ncbi:MAG: hypothetical protein AB7U92_17355 [Piscinibacter sp.]|uniref:hypothetical protein n=1 Tax=Piscinibacter sp. TaxID=1903157 RepID=UPI003D0A3B56
MNHAIHLTHNAGTGAAASGMPWSASASRSRKPVALPAAACAANRPIPRVFAGF